MAQAGGCVLSWDLVQEKEKPECIIPQVLVRSDLSLPRNNSVMFCPLFLHCYEDDAG